MRKFMRARPRATRFVSPDDDVANRDGDEIDKPAAQHPIAKRTVNLERALYEMGVAAGEPDYKRWRDAKQREGERPQNFECE
jgi:hypothetical protein